MNAWHTQRGSLGPEFFLASRLRKHGVDLFEGDTNRDSRRERARKAILDLDLAASIIGRREGKPEDYQSYFQRIYGQPLKVEAP